MASILGYTVSSWPRGILMHAGQRIGAIEPAPGFDGLAIAASGWVNPPQQVSTITAVSGGIGNADALIIAYHKLHRQVGTVNDQLGRTWADVTVMRCSAYPMQTYNASIVWVMADWLLAIPTVRLV